MGSALLKVIGEGCLYGHPWLYADDIILLSPSSAGLQEMVKICENIAKATKLKFSTNIRIEKCKTKCLFFSRKGLL